MRSTTLLLVALAASANGCDARSDSPGAPSTAVPQPGAGSALATTRPAAGMLTSVFYIESYTRNEKGCDREGPSIMSTLEQDLFVYAYEYGKGAGAALVTCDSFEACRAKATAYRERKQLPQTKLMAPFIETIDDTHLEGFLIDTGIGGRKRGCNGAKSTKTELRLDGDTLTFTVRGVQGDIEPDAKGRCSTMHSKATLAGRDCNYYQVLKAKHVAAL